MTLWLDFEGTTLSEISQRKAIPVASRVYVESKIKSHIHRKRDRIWGYQRPGWGAENGKKVVKGTDFQA